MGRAARPTIGYRNPCSGWPQDACAMGLGAPVACVKSELTATQTRRAINIASSPNTSYYDLLGGALEPSGARRP